MQDSFVQVKLKSSKFELPLLNKNVFASQKRFKQKDRDFTELSGAISISHMPPNLVYD